MVDNILVTGGAGFVGSSLVRQLLRSQYEIIVLDNMGRGSAENLPKDERLHIVEGDVCVAKDVDKAMSYEPKYVVHLAAIHFIPYCDTHPSETIRINVHGTQTVLEQISKYDCTEKIVFASSAAVYEPNIELHTEGDKVVPIDIYGASKVMGEQLMDLHHHQTGVAAINARLFNVVGPRETNPHLVPDILEQLPTKEPLNLGNLVPKRDYIYSDDVARGIITLLESQVCTGSYNVGTGQSYSATELVNVISDILGQELKINSVAERQRAGDRPNLCADSNKLRGLGWSCDNDIRETLQKTLEAYGKV